MKENKIYIKVKKKTKTQKPPTCLDNPDVQPGLKLADGR